MKIIYFNLKNIESRQDIRKQYLKLAKNYHPDVNKTPEAEAIMKQVNAEFEFLEAHWTQYVNKNKFEQTKQEKFINLDKFRQALNPIIALQGLNIEICGSWIWCTGMTYPYADIFRKAGYFWSKPKKAWYYNGQAVKMHCKGHYTLGQIRDIHGSFKVETEERKLIK